jgi:hypothetical protein
MVIVHRVSLAVALLASAIPLAFPASAILANEPKNGNKGYRVDVIKGD